MLPKVVVLLLCVVGSAIPAGSADHSTRKHYEVELVDDEYDDAEEWGQSPWLESALPQQVQHPQPLALDDDDEEELDENEMTPAQAAAILAQVTAAAAAARAAAPAQPPTPPPAAAGNLQDPSHIGLFTGNAHMGAGFLDTAADAAGMQFVGVSSPADNILQESFGSAPPWQAVLSPAPATQATARAPAPGEAPAAAAAAAVDEVTGAAAFSAHHETPAPPPAPPAPSPAALTHHAPAPPFNERTPPPAPLMLQRPPAPQPAAPADASTAAEVQLPGVDLQLGEAAAVLDGLAEGLMSAPPFIPPSETAKPPAEPQQQQQPQEKVELAEGTVKASLMGRGLWRAHSKGAFPSDPQVPPAVGNLAPAGFCNPDLGLEPTDDGRCVCMQGFGTNADMRTCSRCPVGWYSRGGQVGIAFCKPCPQLSTSNPSRTACVTRRNVIRPNVPNSLCEPCVISTRPFDPPVCCPRGNVCCGETGCCPSKRCINNATTSFKPRCCGDDCNIGQSLNCCPGGQICVNITGANSQLCCAPGNVCGDTSTKSCCNAGQKCCGNRDCCNTEAGANPKQVCQFNNITGPPVNDNRCCLEIQINCNGTCCTTLDNPPTQRCLVDSTGIAQCCNVVQLCQSTADGITQCCSGTTVCTRNITTTGVPIARCCPAGYSLCPKNSFQPICCIAGKCPSPSSADNCLP